ncbi:MAG: YtxH domain-containing protein [Nitrospirales bacterium]
MKENQTCSSAGQVAGMFIGGILVGSITMLLLAPRSGRETQEQLREYGRRRKQDFRDLQEKTVATYQDVVGDARDSIQELQSIVQDAFQAGCKEMRKARNSATEKSHERPHPSTPAETGPAS